MMLTHKPGKVIYEELAKSVSTIVSLFLKI
jgi:hypothetical protein